MLDGVLTEGAAYTWTAAELGAVLGEADGARYAGLMNVADEPVPLPMHGMMATAIIWILATSGLAVEVLGMLLPWSRSWRRWARSWPPPLPTTRRPQHARGATSTHTSSRPWLPPVH